MVDVYPAMPSTPSVPRSMPALPALPTLDKFELPMRNLLIALVGGLAGKGVAEVIDPTAEQAYWRAK